MQPFYTLYFIAFRWECIIKTDIKEVVWWGAWTGLILLKMDRCRALVNTVLNLQVP